MDEERFNITLRKFLKEVGVTCQPRSRRGYARRWTQIALTHRTLEAKMTLEIGAIGLVHVVTGHIDV